MNFDFSFALEVLPVLLRAMRVTAAATLLGTVLAMALGLVWALLRRSRRRALSLPAAWCVEGIRSTPILVQMYFLFYVLPAWGLRLPPLATGVAALGIHYSAYVSEVYRAGIDGVAKGQWEAALALGFGRMQTMRRVILPQALPPMIPALGNYFIAMFKDTPLLSAITVVEMLQQAKITGSETFRYLEPFTMVGVLFLALSLVAGALVRMGERRWQLAGQGGRAWH